MAGTFSNVNLPDVQIIRQLARDQLKLLLESVPGRKDLVLDAELMRPLDRIAGATLLKEHGVDKIFKLESGKSLAGSCEQRMYLVRPRVHIMTIIANQINEDRQKGIKRSYKILMTPRKLHICERALEQEGVYGYITIEEFTLDFIPLDEDLLSLELPEFLQSVFLEGDQSWIHTAAMSLLNVQQVFGLIPNAYIIGKCAQKVHELTELMFDMKGKPKELNNEIGHVFIVDRSSDYVTPLCSQVTYEGLLDDTFGITSGFIEFGAEVTGRDASAKLLLTSSDPIYDEIRNRHFSNVFNYLSSTAKELQQGYDKRKGLTSVKDMKNFVANDLRGLKIQHKSLSLHVGACEYINTNKAQSDFQEQLRTEHSLLEGVDMRENVSYIEEIINRMFDQTHSLRLLCLLSLTQGGLSSQAYKSLTTQYTQSYGYDQMLTIQNLKRMGLIIEQPESQTTRNLGKVAAFANVNIPSGKTSPFRVLAKKLNLIPKSADEINLKNPSDMSYVFSGAYAPLICRFIEQVLIKEGFTGLEEICKLLSENCYCNIGAKSAKGRGTTGGTTGPPSSRVVFVYFLGGCTYSEITALRFLGKMRGYKFLIGTTSMVNGVSLLKPVTEHT